MARLIYHKLNAIGDPMRTKATPGCAMCGDFRSRMGPRFANPAADV